MYKETRHLTSTEIDSAAKLLTEGRLVVFPTETVYGLGANAYSDAACRSIFEAKGRPPDNPLIVHVPRVEAVDSVAKRIPKPARQLFEAFSPGPLTVVLPRRAEISAVATTGLESVAVRIPAHPVARELLEACGLPIAAPSANRSGKPSPTDAESAADYMDGRVDAVIDGGPCENGLESTICRIVEDGGDVRGAVDILREGSITREMIRSQCDVRIAPSPAARGDSREIRAPGTAHRHYEPAARCITVDGSAIGEVVQRELLLGGASPVGVIGLGSTLARQLEERPELLTVPVSSLEEYAHELYRAFHRFDAAGCRLIVAEWPPAAGLGPALRDRLRRASGGSTAAGESARCGIGP